MSSSKFLTPSLAVSHVVTKGVAVNARQRTLREHPLPSQTRTVASGTTVQLLASSFSELPIIRSIGKTLGETSSEGPTVLGIMLKLRQSITLPALINAVVEGELPDFERLAHCSLNVMAGKAGSGYLMGRSDSLGAILQMYRLSGGFGDQLRAVDSVVSGRESTFERVGTNLNGAMVSAIDNIVNGESRPVVMPYGSRVCNLIFGGSALEDGTQFFDVFPWFFTGDGIDGVSGAGISLDELGSTTNQWVWNLTLDHDASAYPVGTVFGAWTLEVSVLYRVNADSRNGSDTSIAAPAYGPVWQWNRTLGTVQNGTATSLPGEALKGHIFVGYLPEYRDPDANVDFFWQEIDAGGGYDARLSVIPPRMNPSTAFNTAQNYVQVGDPVDYSVPAGYNQLAFGNELLQDWNAPFKGAARISGVGNFRGGLELSTFGDTGFRTATSSMVLNTANGSLRFGATFGAGAPVTTVAAINNGSKRVLAGIGGLHAFPLAFAQRGTNGFNSIEPRALDDSRSIRVNTVNGFALPAGAGNDGDTSLRNVHVVRFLQPYAAFTGAGCDPCGEAPMKPVAARFPGDSLASALASGLSATFVPAAVAVETGKGK